MPSSATKTAYVSAFSTPFYMSAKPAGAACNLACDYCYYLEKKETLHSGQASVSPLAGQGLMSDYILEIFVKQYIEAQTTPSILFIWHGGEPLLRGIDFYKKALQFQRKYRGHRQIDNCIQTNGTLLTDEWCRFLQEHNFLVGISIDGPEHIHNRYRIKPQRQTPVINSRQPTHNGSFVDTLQGLELLLKHNVEFNILAVVNDYNAQYPIETYRFLKSIGSPFLQFTPVVERIITQGPQKGRLATPNNAPEQTQISSHSVAAEAYGQFLCAIFDDWVRQDVGRIYIQLFDATLACRVGHPPGSCLYTPQCGHALALEHNGNVYSCDHFAFNKYYLGNILETPLTTLAYSNQQLAFGRIKSELSEHCEACEFLKLCYGECPKNRIIRSPQGHPHNYLCTGLKQYFQHVMPYIDFMANEYRNQRPPANVMGLF